MTENIWNYFTSTLKVSWCKPKTIGLALEYWEGLKMNKNRRAIWNLVPKGIVWNVWEDRNNEIFKEEKLNNTLDIEDAKGTVFLWTRNIKEHKLLSYRDIVINWEAWMM